jgi:hypothetical protein
VTCLEHVMEVHGWSWYRVSEIGDVAPRCHVIWLAPATAMLAPQGALSIVIGCTASLRPVAPHLVHCVVSLSTRQGLRTATENRLVTCDESGHTKLPVLSVVLCWGELPLILP